MGSRGCSKRDAGRYWCCRYHYNMFHARFSISIAHVRCTVLYVALSFLSLAAVLSKFQSHRYRWIEKWIHLAVYIFPLSSATYLLTVDAYNPSIRDCYVTSIPMGCGENSDIPCTRGPQNIFELQMYNLAIPFLVVLFLPAAVMTALYIHVRFRQGPSGRVVAYSVARQSWLYLLALYWTYFFRIVDAGMIAWADKYIFALNLLANTVEAFQGLWILMVYWYFRSEDPSQVFPLEPPNASENNNDKVRRIASSVNTFKTTSIVSFGNVASDINLEAPSSPTSPRRRRVRRRVSATRSDTSSGYLTRPEFSIFDGSKNYDASESPWSAFLTDEFEDSGYQENCEYDDTEFFGMTEGRKSTTKASTTKAAQEDSTSINEDEATGAIDRGSNSNADSTPSSPSSTISA